MPHLVPPCDDGLVVESVAFKGMLDPQTGGTWNRLECTQVLRGTLLLEVSSRRFRGPE
jgi:hypothetical protein